MEPLLRPEQAPTGVVTISAKAGGAGATLRMTPELSIQPSLVPVPVGKKQMKPQFLATRTLICGIVVLAGNSK